MKHNFPKDVRIICKDIHNLKQGKELLKLAVDFECPIGINTLNEIVNKLYPRFTWYGNVICLTSLKPENSRSIWVTFEEFKAFIQGKGVYIAPFKQELELNSEYKATVTKEYVKVGCQEFSHDVIKKLYQLSQKALKS